MNNIGIEQVQVVREKGFAYAGGDSISTSEKAHEILRPLVERETVETFWAICLNGKNQIETVQLVSRGSLGATLVHPRETFRLAVLSGAAAIIVGHNHPSGSLDPSSEDGRLTGRLRRAGEILGIPVLDHLIIGSEGYFSFADHGWANAKAIGE